MFNLLDGLSELVYILDVDTYELLFMNTAGKETFKIDDVGGQICYQVLHGKEEPCDFCPNKKLKEDTFYTWELDNQVAKRHYLLKDRLVEWPGRNAKIEIAFDMTEKEEQRIKLKNALDTENLIVECVEILWKYGSLRESSHMVLKKIGQFLESDRAGLYKLESDGLKPVSEWGPPLPMLLRQETEKWFPAVPPRWQEVFKRNTCLVIRDKESLKEVSYGEWQILDKGNIDRMAAAPIHLGGKLYGYIGISNPSQEKLANVIPLLKTISNFIASCVLREEDSQKLERLSYFDTLTGAMNRNAYMRDLEQISQLETQPVGLVHLNINGMKELNERRGHVFGDYALVEYARELRELFPKDRVYRIGGDEFFVLCFGTSKEAFETSVWALKKAIEEKLKYKAACGYAWSEDNRDVKALVFVAGEWMNQDKKRYYRRQAVPRRYRHNYDDALGLTKPGVLEKQLREGRFPVYLQPKFSVLTEKVIGAEALIRYLSPEAAIVGPDKFIPILEETRLIGKVDFYVFEYICGKMSRWLSQGKKAAPVSVNFSRYTISEPDFYERLLKIRGNYQIPAGLIELEVTESAQEEENCDFPKMIKRLQSAGFLVSIDDFGVQNANLSLFANASFDVLKIDKSLIQELEESDRARIILQSVSDICKKVDVQMIVEGVETAAQLEILRRIGCGFVQGYLFCRPLPMEEFEEKYL